MMQEHFMAFQTSVKIQTSLKLDFSGTLNGLCSALNQFQVEKLLYFFLETSFGGLEKH